MLLQYPSFNTPILPFPPSAPPIPSGTTCIATTNPSFSEATKIFEVILKSSPPAPPTSKNPGPALIYWMEVQHHPGLVCAISKTTSNPVTLLIKPESIQVHELKALPNKAKVQGMVAMRQPPSAGELVSDGSEWKVCGFLHKTAFATLPQKKV